MITSISLSAGFEAYYGEAGPLKAFGPLSRINLIVGSNNSGKSRFMRLLASRNQYRVTDSLINLSGINRELSEVIEALENIEDSRIIDEMGLVRIQNFRVLPDDVVMGGETYFQAKYCFDEWSGIQKVTSSDAVDGIDRADEDEVKVRIREFAKRGLKILERAPGVEAIPHYGRVYIPILRGLRQLDSEHTDFYAKKTIEDYFNKSSEEPAPEVFTGLSFYRNLTDLLLGNNSKRRQIAEYQDLISKRLFAGQEVVLMPNKDYKVITIKIGKEVEQPHLSKLACG